MKRLFVILIAIPLLTACGHIQRAMVDNVTPPLDRVIPAVVLEGKAFIAVDQNITVENDDTKDRFLLRTEIAPGRMAMLGFATMGRARFDVAIDAQGIVSHGHSTWLSAQKMASDFQLIFWPHASLQAVLQGSGFVVVDETQKRIITYNGKPYAVITYSHRNAWQSVITLNNLHHHYTLILENLHSES